jgi:hypothetical protein
MGWASTLSADLAAKRVEAIPREFLLSTAHRLVMERPGTAAPGTGTNPKRPSARLASEAPPASDQSEQPA